MANEICERTNPLRSVKHILSFLRIIDPHDGLISLTNLMMMIVLAKLALSKNPSLIDLGTFLCAIATYTAKKVINQGAVTLPESTPPRPGSPNVVQIVPVAKAA